MTIECARESSAWREKYSVLDSEPYDVRGLLFIHNHDNGYAQPFYEAIRKVKLQNLSVSPGTVIYFLGPHDIQRLYSIGNDIIRLKEDGQLSNDYTFYYPDLVMFRRHGEVWEQPATIELLTGPYIIIKYREAKSCGAGLIIYYNRKGESSEEFEYFLDSLSRYQLLESEQIIRIRVTNSDAIGDLKSVFDRAKKKYAKAWGFDPRREKLLQAVEIDRITSVTNTYNPGDMGWRE